MELVHAWRCGRLGRTGVSLLFLLAALGAWGCPLQGAEAERSASSGRRSTAQTSFPAPAYRPAEQQRIPADVSRILRERLGAIRFGLEEEGLALVDVLERIASEARTRILLDADLLGRFARERLVWSMPISGDDLLLSVCRQGPADLVVAEDYLLLQVPADGQTGPTEPQDSDDLTSIRTEVEGIRVGRVLETPISLELVNIRFDEALRRLEREIGVRLPLVIEVPEIRQTHVSLDVRDVPASEVLRLLFKIGGADYRIVDGEIRVHPAP